MVNDLGVDPNEWFEDRPHNPLDDMPIANGNNKYAPPERLAELEAELAEEPPRPEEDIAGWFKDETEPLDIPIEETLHEKMYQMATNRYNPFSVGGSENCDSDISCNKLGGSEEVRPSTPK